MVAGLTVIAGVPVSATLTTTVPVGAVERLAVKVPVAPSKTLSAAVDVTSGAGALSDTLTAIVALPVSGPDFPVQWQKRYTLPPATAGNRRS